MLAEKTEGWAAALRLATLTLRYSGDVESHIAGLYAENRYVMDYLVREVLSSLPPHIQSFLLKTAILDQLSGPLCDAITRQDESHLERPTVSGMAGACERIYDVSG